MNLLRLEIFVSAAEGGSLAQSARKLGISAMAASRHLAALEAELKVRLLHRSNRSVSLTPEGVEFLPYARRMLGTYEEAKSKLNPTASDATGLLRITSPAAFARTEIIPLLPELLKHHRRLRVELNMSDQMIDVQSMGFDVAIRIASLKDSELVARPLVDNYRILCASPDYLAQHGTPKRLADLAGHACLTISANSRWRFQQGDEEVALSVSGPLLCNSNEGLRMAAIHGLGLFMATPRTVKDDLLAGRLVRIDLDDATERQVTIWTVFPSRRYVPARVRVFLAMLKARVGEPV